MSAAELKLIQWQALFLNISNVNRKILIKTEELEKSIDRLLHHSHMINILGDSYRLKEKKEEGMVDSDLYKFKARKPIKGVN